MTAHVKNSLLALAISIISVFAFVLPVSAAAPDGAGPWADSVHSTTQGMMKNGAAVPPIRSDSSSALGVAENDTVDGNFYSLGFGGNIALGFDNGISSGVILVEATNPGYPGETAKVEVSENGTTWVVAGNVTTDGQVNKPDSITCARYVRITDTSDPANFSDATADGYDVDGVRASGEPCVVPTPTPPCTTGSGGSSVVKQNNTTVVNTTVISKTNTGNNKTNFNTGGSNTITTGGSTTTTTVGVVGGTNTNSSTCCATGSTNVKISGNGAGSKNKVVIFKGKK